MNEPNVFSNPCAICKKREATQLCDYVIDYDHTLIFFRNWKDFKEANESPRYETCDLPICKECSHERNNLDFCPHHYKLHQQVQLPENLRMAQAKSKGKIYSITGKATT